MATKFLVKYWRKLNLLISEYEKILLALLSVAIIISGTLWYRQFAAVQTDGPAVGGSFVEGIVGGKKEVSQIANKLTKAGLFNIDQDGKLQNLLVDSWQANADSTDFSFQLKKGVDPNEIVDDLQAESDLLGAVTADNDGSQLNLHSAFSDPSLPLLLARPLFNYGPYKMSKMTDKTTIFTRNTRENAAKPYINKIVIHTFANEADLEKAVGKKSLDAAVVNSDIDLPSGYTSQSVKINRYYALLFNLNRSPFRDAGLRTALINHTTPPATPFTLTVSDQEPQKTLAANLVQKWQDAGAKVTLDVKPNDTIINQISPARDFQAMVIGLDYGVDLDPFYVWSSTQLRPPGNNLTGVKSATIDDLLGKIRATLDTKARLGLIDLLHQQISKESVGTIVQQEAVTYVVSDNVRYESPYVAVTPMDRFLAASLWSVK